MRIRLVAVGTRMPAWVQAGFAEYTVRFPREWRFALTEVAPAPRARNADLARVRDSEGQAVLKALPRTALAVALDERGESWSTAELARQLAGWQQQAQDVCLLVGGADGHAPAVLARATRHWSLSPLTLPHALVRVLVAEQLYRAWSVLANHPYHRA